MYTVYLTKLREVIRIDFDWMYFNARGSVSMPSWFSSATQSRTEVSTFSRWISATSVATDVCSWPWPAEIHSIKQNEFKYLITNVFWLILRTSLSHWRKRFFVKKHSKTFQIHQKILNLELSIIHSTITYSTSSLSIFLSSIIFRVFECSVFFFKKYDCLTRHIFDDTRVARGIYFQK
jgi:hypothetical protein